MKRLLLIFIVIGNSLPLLPALPHQEASLEQFEKSKKSHSETISLGEESENSVEDVLKKLGRTIHQTAWSQENKDEPNSSESKTVQTNSAKNTNSWDLSHLLKLLLNLVHSNEEDKSEENGKDNNKTMTKAHSSNEFQNSTAESSKSGGSVQTKYGEKDQTEENVGSGKDNSKSINKARNSDESQNSTVETSKSPGSSQTKYGENQKHSLVESVSSSESNSYSNNQSDSSYDQKKQKSKIVTNSLQKGKIAKTAQSSKTKKYSSLKFGNKDFSKTEQLIDKLDLLESERKQSIGENDYYDDYYDEESSEDEYCDSYSSSFSSEKSSTTETESNKITEDSYEVGGIEIFDDDYLKLFSENNEKIKSKMQTKKDSLALVSQNETGMEEIITNQDTKEYYDFSLVSDEVSSKNETDDENETNKQYPIQDITTVGLETEGKLENYSDEINILQIGSTSPEQNVTPTTKRYQIVLENTEYQNNNTEKSDTKQSLTSNQTYIQSTTPFIADSITLPVEIAETWNTENTQNYSFSSSSPFDVTTLVTKSPDKIQIHNPEKKKITFKSESNNLETNQELLQSLPLSSSGEFISNISEKNKQSSNTSENGKQSLPTSEETQLLLITSETKRKFSDTTESDKQVLNTSESVKQFTNTSESDTQVSNNSESDQKLTKTSKTDTHISSISEIDQQLTKTSESETQASNISGIDQQLTNNSESEAKLSNISKSDQKLTNTSENDIQASSISEIDQQLTNTPESETRVSNVFGNIQQLTNTSESETQVFNISENDQTLINTSESETQTSNISEKDQQLSNTSERESEVSNISESEAQVSNISESDTQVSNISASKAQISNISESDTQVSNTSESNQQFSNLLENDQLFPITSDNDKQLISLETDSELSESQNNFVKNEEEKTQSENSNSSSLTKEQEEIPPSLQNVIVLDIGRNLNIDGEAKELVPEEKNQKINEFAYQQDELQKDNEKFKTSEVIIFNNEADENLNINQNDDSLLVDEVSNPASGMSPTYVETSKNMEENTNDNDYYEFDVEVSPGNSVYENDEKSLESVKTSQMIGHSNQNGINQPSEPEKPYDTILEFLYKHSNSPFIKSLKEYQY